MADPKSGPVPGAPPLGTIVQGDLLEVLPTWPEGCVDLVFADPPFNIGYKYDTYHDNVAPPEYLKWTRRWLDQCLRVLTPSGSFWIAIGDEYAAEVRVMMRPRATLRNWVIWRYTFGQNCKAKFNRGHAHLFYFVKDPGDFTFNADDRRLRIKSDRQLKYNDRRANPKGKLPDDVWTFSRVCGTFKERVGWHPCQMPVKLLDRIVLACSRPGDVVLDPFAGSGTTLVAAARHGRRWVGTELSEQYASLATRRIEEDMGLLPRETRNAKLNKAPSASAGNKAPSASAGNKAPSASAGNEAPSASAGNKAPSASAGTLDQMPSG